MMKRRFAEGKKERVVIALFVCSLEINNQMKRAHSSLSVSLICFSLHDAFEFMLITTMPFYQQCIQY